MSDVEIIHWINRNSEILFELINNQTNLFNKNFSFIYAVYYITQKFPATQRGEGVWVGVEVGVYSGFEK